MSERHGSDGLDELGLAEVAWELRTTLASAGDVPVSGDERVLTTIRRRSTQRRRAKRVLSTSMAAFALSLSTLAVVKGGQVAIDHGIAGNAEPPAVTPGNGSDGGDPTKVTEPTTPGTQARNRKGPNDCKPDPQTGVVACQPNGQAEDPTSTAQGGTVDPTKSTVPGGPTPGPTVTSAPSTVTPTTAAPTTTAQNGTGKSFTCPDILADTVPSDPGCFKRHVDAGDNVSLLVQFYDPANTTKLVTRGWSYFPNENPAVKLEAPDPPNRGLVWQCPTAEFVGVGPEWYVLTPECVRWV
jgi:hypothetical protein